LQILDPLVIDTSVCIHHCPELFPLCQQEYLWKMTKIHLQFVVGEMQVFPSLHTAGITAHGCIRQHQVCLNWSVILLEDRMLYRPATIRPVSQTFLILMLAEHLNLYEKMVITNFLDRAGEHQMQLDH
jgi:hypothetical protein